ncbi:hypothetical protein [Halobaculum gomorrense]|uniref:hypothetical protein n=1 Tax=Halobaculum gomorrense TaxID=43928 RepID=UPI00135664D9|nr:hypothetical protein [Halobaculum gomorrense]
MTENEPTPATTAAPPVETAPTNAPADAAPELVAPFDPAASDRDRDPTTDAAPTGVIHP